VIRSRVGEVRTCDEPELVDHHHLRGLVEVLLEIGPTGAVRSAVITLNETENTAVGDCITAAIDG